MEVGNGKGITAVKCRQVTHQRLLLGIENMGKKQRKTHQQYAAEKPWDDLQVRIYAGADGDFVLYEDEGDGYAYEKGVFSEIPMHWDDAASVLTIGARKGAWPGMPQERRFRVVIVRPEAGTGLDRAACDVAVTYAGAQVRVDLN